MQLDLYCEFMGEVRGPSSCVIDDLWSMEAKRVAALRWFHKVMDEIMPIDPEEMA